MDRDEAGAADYAAALASLPVEGTPEHECLMCHFNLLGTSKETAGQLTFMGVEPPAHKRATKWHGKYVEEIVERWGWLDPIDVPGTFAHRDATRPLKLDLSVPEDQYVTGEVGSMTSSQHDWAERGRMKR